MPSLPLIQLPENQEDRRQLAAKNGWLANTAGDGPGSAFPQKRSTHAGMVGVAVGETGKMALLDSLHSKVRGGSSAAYVHLPYCVSRCIYCGFFGGKYTTKTGASYLKALLWEIENEARYPSTLNEPIQALYLGGGTPTALEAHELHLLITTLRECLPLSNDCEITVEGRNAHFGPEKIEACLKAGANRFSIGVQTFNTEMRRKLGRIFSKEEVIAHLKSLRQYNQAAIIIDLIYGLPGQSLEDWKEDIKTFLDLSLDGVDLYQLSVFPGSLLQKAIATGEMPPAALLPEQESYFLEGLKIMEAARYRRLSISHWGRTSRERNMYNPLVKTRSDCLHFGSGSGGSLHGYFMVNESNPELYMELCSRKQKPITLVMAPPLGLRAVQTILEHMEHCRLPLDVLTCAYEEIFRAEASFDATTFFNPLLDNWEQSGLIKRDNTWIELTPVGQFWQVNITQALLGWQNLAFKEVNHVDTH